jgi:hypothetical protein
LSQARIAELEAQNAVLEARLAAVEALSPKPPAPRPGGQVCIEPATTVRTLPPSSAFQMATEDELRKLAERVFDGHEGLRKEAAESSNFFRDFSAAFRAVGVMRRTDAPDAKRYFDAHIDDVNVVLGELGERGRRVDGVAVLTAILAHGDIPWRRHDRAIGQPLEVGLNRWIGRACSNHWRDVLRGAQLLVPLPSRYGQLHSSERAPRPKT